ncbi:hypothetical protein [Streptomyces sp. NPDC005423]|uniref:hypothetical protein n=1 Tax=Streptomyces sp. NPDC005423 TaxID=3155343 RepID=UPI00339E064C
MAVLIALLLIAGAVFAVAVQRRLPPARRLSDLSDLDAEAEASGWVLRLGAGLPVPETKVWAGADRTATEALTRAAECHHAAAVQLTEAGTASEYAQAGRTARQGLDHIATAREALGAQPPAGPPTPPARGLGAPHFYADSAA